MFFFFFLPSIPPPPLRSLCLPSPNRNPSAGINKIELCAAHQLLAAGTDDGFVHFWDARQGQSAGGRAVASLDLRDAVGAAAVNAAEQTIGGFQVRGHTGRGRGGGGGGGGGGGNTCSVFTRVHEAVHEAGRVGGGGGE